jgi:malonyl-CoA O-methyltransferase
MSTIDKTSVKKSFNRHAAIYDRNAALQKRFGKFMLTFLNGNVKKAASILDIGMGTGAITELLMQRFPGARIHGCDLAMGMIARARAREYLNPHRDLFITADGECLPYRDNHFDLVISGFTYQWLESPDMAFKEALRVLKPGGLFLYSAFGDNTFTELKAAYTQACREINYTRGEALQLRFTEKNCSSTMQSAGLIGTFMHAFRVQEQYASVRELVRSIKHMGAQNASQDRNRSLGMKKLWNRMVAIYEHDFSSNNTITATYEIIIGGGQKS